MSDHKRDKSDMTNSNQNNGQSHAWEEWQLTALVLGELDAETTAIIQSAAKKDQSLASDILSIKHTIGEVRNVFASETREPGLGVDQQQRLDRIISQASSAEPRTAAEISPGKISSAARKLPSGRRMHRFAWVGLLGMAASLFVAVYLATPGISEWLVASNDAKQVSERETPDASPAEPLTVAAPSPAPFELAAESEESEKMESEGEPFGDVHVEMIDELDLVIVKGSQQDVQRTAEAIEKKSPSTMPAVGGFESKLADAEAKPSSEGFARGDMYGGGTGAGGLGGPGGGLAGPGSGQRRMSSGYDLGAPTAGNALAQNTPAQNTPPSEALASNDGMGGMGGMGAGAGYGGEGGGYGDEVMGGMGRGYGGEGGYGTGMGAGYGGMGGGGYGGGGYGGYGGGYGAGANSWSEMSRGGTRLSVSQQRNQTTFGERVDSASTAMEAQELVPLQVQERELVESVGPQHPAVRAVRQRILRVEQQVANLRDAERRLAVEEQLLAREAESGDRFDSIYENRFTQVEAAPLSTLSIDVDTASYTKARQLLLEARRLPPADAVRIEEFVNYFDYEYTGPKDSDDPFGSDLAVANCPWRPEHKLVRIALQATKLELENRAKANIVFLLDVSGSMGEPNKLPLVKESMRMLIQQLGENDRVAMVVYAGAAGCVLEGTRGNEQEKIMAALDQLNAGGSTNGGQGIQLAYDLARDNFVEGGINRVILCTDGDFNVGVTNTQALVDLVEVNAKSNIFLTVLGYGMGNTNDAMMEQISNRGNGVYGFVDNRREAHRQMVKQLAGNLVTVAKDVKIQVEFNPEKVQSYRLLGYENRLLAAKDFDDDTKDAGEIGAGHRVTALYEVVPVGAEEEPEGEPELLFQKRAAEPPKSNDKPATKARSEGEESNDELTDAMLAVKLRYKQPEATVSKKLVFLLEDASVRFDEADRDFRWAASMVEFGMLLRHSRHAGNATWSSLLERASSAAGVSPDADRQECLEMIRTAAALNGQ